MPKLISPSKPPKKTFLLRIPVEAAAKLDRLAKRDFQRRAQWITKVIMETPEK